MALLSLGFLLLAIMLGFIRKMNTGLLCIAFALLLGRMAGISDAEIIKGFNASLFLMLLGVTGDDVLPLEIYNDIKIKTLSQVRGTVQADILKEDQAQNTCIFSHTGSSH